MNISRYFRLSATLEQLFLVLCTEELLEILYLISRGAVYYWMFMKRPNSRSDLRLWVKSGNDAPEFLIKVSTLPVAKILFTY